MNYDLMEIRLKKSDIILISNQPQGQLYLESPFDLIAKKVNLTIGWPCNRILVTFQTGVSSPGSEAETQFHFNGGTFSGTHMLYIGSRNTCLRLPNLLVRRT